VSPLNDRARTALAVAVLACTPCLGACKAKASASQCDQLIDRYATLVVTEKLVDASAAAIQAEQAREKAAARGDDAFKNCSSEVSQAEFDCAMRTTSPDAFEKCLE
jgi:hypothetical protein